MISLHVNLRIAKKNKIAKYLDSKFYYFFAEAPLATL